MSKAFTAILTMIRRTLCLVALLMAASAEVPAKFLTAGPETTPSRSTTRAFSARSSRTFVCSTWKLT